MTASNPTAAILPLEDYRKSNKPPAAEKPAADLFQGLAAKIPPVPGNLSDTARKHWYFIGERLVVAHLISEVDLGQFQILCQTWALYVDAHLNCERFGEYQTTPNGYEQLAPWAVARERHANRYQKIADKFFLSPRARKAVNIENPHQGDLDLD